MIRFKPDTWLEFFLRFFAMAAPDANVYVEIPAPDLRFAALILVAVAVVLCWRRLAANPRAALALLMLMLVATVPWMITSGNGRYWIPILLCAGPAVAGLIYLLPLSRWFRLFMAAALLAAQAFVVLQNSPWDAWTWATWQDAPYFQVDLPGDAARAPPTTYVTLSTISYSLIAPQFPPASRWINITSGGGVIRDAGWTAEFLGKAGRLVLLAPSIRGQVQADRQPSPEVRQALDTLIGPVRLALDANQRCELLTSGGLAAIGHRQGAKDFEGRDQIGFWACPLRYPVDRPPAPVTVAPARTEAVLDKVEQLCPRFFRPREAKTLPIAGGSLRQYPNSDMKVYVLDDGQVLYKFWRALNPVAIGSVDDVLSGKATVDCDHIRGRTGLPWDREI